jgi:cleavage and polyadenylation specificity factor subunit 2
MGQMLLYDFYQSKLSEGDFELFSLDDVDAVFETFTKLKYSQTVTITGTNIEITAFPAGRHIGAAYWKVRKDTEEVIYAVDFNHKKERLDFLTHNNYRHLAGTNLAGDRSPSRPAVLITDTLNATAPQISRTTKESELIGI